MERREGSNHTYPKSEISTAAKLTLTSWACQLPRRNRGRAALIPAPPAVRCPLYDHPAHTLGPPDAHWLACMVAAHPSMLIPMPAGWPARGGEVVARHEGESRHAIKPPHSQRHSRCRRIKKIDSLTVAVVGTCVPAAGTSSVSRPVCRS
jgi:hypothetical protein